MLEGDVLIDVGSADAFHGAVGAAVGLLAGVRHVVPAELALVFAGVGAHRASEPFVGQQYSAEIQFGVQGDVGEAPLGAGAGGREHFTEGIPLGVLCRGCA